MVGCVYETFHFALVVTTGTPPTLSRAIVQLSIRLERDTNPVLLAFSDKSIWSFVALSLLDFHCLMRLSASGRHTLSSNKLQPPNLDPVTQTKPRSSMGPCMSTSQAFLSWTCEWGNVSSCAWAKPDSCRWPGVYNVIMFSQWRTAWQARAPIISPKPWRTCSWIQPMWVELRFSPLAPWTTSGPWVFPHFSFLSENKSKHK